MEQLLLTIEEDNKVLLNELLNIKYPIIQGAMANIATASFAACVSNSGGLGIIATGSMDAAQTREEIQKCKQLTDQPFGVNVMLMNPYASEIIDVIVEEGVHVVTTGAGNPGPYMAKLKEAGIKVLPVVPSVGLAKRMERAGADALIVEGGESGGHVGEMTTMALVPQVVDAVNIPVIAAGGIWDGKDIKKFLGLGASGVQMATRFVATDECDASQEFKEAYVNAKQEDIKIIHSPVGMPGRAINNQFIQKEETQKSKIEKCYGCIKTCNVKDAPYCITKALINSVKGNIEKGLIFCGSNVYKIKEIVSVHSLMQELVAGIA